MKNQFTGFESHDDLMIQVGNMDGSEVKTICATDPKSGAETRITLDAVADFEVRLEYMLYRNNECWKRGQYCTIDGVPIDLTDAFIFDSSHGEPKHSLRLGEDIGFLEVIDNLHSSWVSECEEINKGEQKSHLMENLNFNDKWAVKAVKHINHCLSDNCKRMTVKSLAAGFASEGYPDKVLHGKIHIPISHEFTSTGNVMLFGFSIKDGRIEMTENINGAGAVSVELGRAQRKLARKEGTSTSKSRRRQPGTVMQR